MLLGGVNPAHSNAFTLAEVLITLGIIGVVAALTLPSVIQNYKKRVVETRLKYTYSVFNEAIKLSEIKNGESSTWTLPTRDYDADETKAFLETYIAPYVKNVKFAKRNSSSCYVNLVLPNGVTTSWSMDTAKRFEVYTRFKYNTGNSSETGGVNYFVFLFTPKDGKFEPYGKTTGYQYNNDLTSCTNGNCCNPAVNGVHANCLLLIQQNGWKIPDNYPFRF
jgi:prepilin-type N-terminal cleavage/methylation domain-containing protein